MDYWRQEEDNGIKLIRGSSIHIQYVFHSLSFSDRICINDSGFDYVSGGSENKEGSVLLNDALNTFYLRLYIVTKYGRGPFRLRDRKPTVATWVTLSD